MSFSGEECSDLGQAEIILNGALEPQTASVGGTFVSSGDVPEGQTARFFVRAAGWQWGQPQSPLEFTCCTDGSGRICQDTERGNFTLSCKKAEGGG